MAKIPFSKLDSKINSDIKNIKFVNSKGEEISIEVKYYLPTEEKMIMISNIINQSLDGNGYYNPMKIKVFTVLEVMYAYTNLSFTAKQKETPYKLYDQLISNGIFQEVQKNIFDGDWKEIEGTIMTTIDNVYKYKNSIVGILDTISTDYSNLEFDAQSIQESLANPESLELLKSVLTKLG